MNLNEIAHEELAKRKASGEIPEDQEIVEVLDDVHLITVICQTKTFSFEKPEADHMRSKVGYRIMS